MVFLGTFYCFFNMLLWPDPRFLSEANIRRQLKTPFENMPSFSGLSQKDTDALIAFLKTL